MEHKYGLTSNFGDDDDAGQDDTKDEASTSKANSS